MTGGDELLIAVPWTPGPRRRRLNLTGRRYGRLTIESFAGANGKKTLWLGRCDCGTLKRFVGAELQKGKTQSCGCLAREAAKRRLTTHGLSSHPAYAVWSSMLDRCTLPSHRAFHNYGGRGICVCERWRRFENFWADMGATWKQGLTLDRLNNEKGYEPSNCEWRTPKQQSRNKRTNVTIQTPRGPMLIAEAAEVSGINTTTLCYRVGAGWPAERLFDKPDCRNRV